MDPNSLAKAKALKELSPAAKSVLNILSLHSIQYIDKINYLQQHLKKLNDYNKNINLPPLLNQNLEFFMTQANIKIESLPNIMHNGIRSIHPYIEREFQNGKDADVTMADLARYCFSSDAKFFFLNPAPVLLAEAYGMVTTVNNHKEKVECTIKAAKNTVEKIKEIMLTIITVNIISKYQCSYDELKDDLVKLITTYNKIIAHYLYYIRTSEKIICIFNGQNTTTSDLSWAELNINTRLKFLNNPDLDDYTKKAIKRIVDNFHKTTQGSLGIVDNVEKPCFKAYIIKKLEQKMTTDGLIMMLDDFMKGGGDDTYDLTSLFFEEPEALPTKKILDFSNAGNENDNGNVNVNGNGNGNKQTLTF